MPVIDIQSRSLCYFNKGNSTEPIHEHFVERYGRLDIYLLTVNIRFCCDKQLISCSKHDILYWPFLVFLH